MQVVAEWTGAKAKALRQARRLTMEEFASRLGVGVRSVAKWDAQPTIVPKPETQAALDTFLDQGGDDVKARFAVLVEGDRPPPPRVTHGNGVSAALPDFGLPGLPVGTATPELVTYLRQSLHQHYTADNRLGPRVLLPMVAANVKMIDQMRLAASGRLLDDLLSIGAGYAEFAGWLSEDSGDAGGAASWYARALEWSEVAEDDRLASFSLTRRAVQAIGQGDVRYGAKLARAAQRFNTPITARVRTIAATTEALGHAIAGDGGEADRALDTASGFLGIGLDAPLDGDPSYGRYCELDLYIDITRAKVQLELGRPEAVEAFTTVIAALPSDWQRDRAQYTALLAHAHLLAGQPEDASARGEEALTIALATGSTRTVGEVRRMAAKQAAMWSGHAPAERLREMLAAVPDVNGR
ncbi:helix-turn-helix domain-containing protein [Phytomonospora sp. NPDC050363]|uniref:helix-turn-helix domain-containing protein n=1 Tax=Phytomonospora sp. NPDC050363 TaxID=3155642 RepID=UPI0033F7C087